MPRAIRWSVVLLTVLTANPLFGQQLDAGIRLQKAISFYTENGVTVQYTNPKLIRERLYVGVSYVTSRLGTALNSNAIKQDNVFATVSYYFRPKWLIQPVVKVNGGYFRADYGDALFDDLPKTSPLVSPELGLCYRPNVPLKINASVGYNLLTGDGVTGPGTLFPVFVQTSITWSILKNGNPDMKTLLSLLFIVVVGLACSSEPEITPEMLDGGKNLDPSLYKPEQYLVSRARPNPTPAQAQRPVVVAIHGYTATTFEWDEYRAYLGGRTDVYLSQVLLGGHGRSYEDFRASSWRDWQASITTEYDALLTAGYRNITLVGSSTGGALLLELLSSGHFAGRPAPRNVMLVDPIVVSSDKALSLVQAVGPVLGHVETEQSAAEDKVYYRFRPQETLQELQKLLTVVRKDLKRGIALPAGCAFKVYKSKQDAVADPVSAVLIHKGVRTAEGDKVAVQFVDSDPHVFTRLNLRENVTAQDRPNQTAAFTDITAWALR